VVNSSDKSAQSPGVTNCFSTSMRSRIILILWRDVRLLIFRKSCFWRKPVIVTLFFVGKDRTWFKNTNISDRRCNEVRWHPGQKASLALPCSNLRFFGSKCTVLNKLLVTLLGRFGSSRSHSASLLRFGARGIVPPFVTPLFQTRR